MNLDVIFSFLGSAAGCIGGIIATQRLTAYRLEQLEKKVDRHNCLVERMAVAEHEIENLKENLN